MFKKFIKIPIKEIIKDGLYDIKNPVFESIEFLENFLLNFENSAF